jgi:hypothetical protein
MNMKRMDSCLNLTLAACFAFAVGLLVSIAVIGMSARPRDYTEEIQQTVREGQAAKLAGVPASANPYIGTSGWAARIWLAGWMGGKVQE